MMVFEKWGCNAPLLLTNPLKGYLLDLLNEVLNIHFGQGAAKISEVKVVGRKKSARSDGPSQRNLEGQNTPKSLQKMQIDSE